MNTRRDTVLDITKAIGIILMVMGHLHFSEDVFDKYIYAFHMPLFFIVSGILFNQDKTLKNTIISRTKALLVPYVVFGGVYSVIFIVKSMLAGEADAVASTLKVFFLYPVNKVPYESALWFLPAMFITSVAYAWLRKVMDVKWATVVAVASGAIGFIYPHLTDVRLPWGIDTALVALLFFHTGCLMKHCNLVERIKALRRKSTLLLLVLTAAVFALNIFMVFMNDKVNLRKVEYGNPLLAYVNAVAGTVLCIMVAVLIDGLLPASKFKILMCRISEVSIVFICINHNVIHLFQFLLSSIGSGVFGIILITLLSLSLILLVGHIIDRTPLRIVIGRK